VSGARRKSGSPHEAGNEQAVSEVIASSVSRPRLADQLKELRLMMRCLAGVAVAFASVVVLPWP
jgi:hypothetical protein